MTAPLTLRDDLREFERLLSALIDADRESELLGAAPGCSPAEAEVARKKWLDAHGALLAEVRELRAPPEASPATARELGSDLCVECKHPIHWHAPSRPGCKGPKPCACGLTRGEAHGRAAAPAPASPAAPLENVPHDWKENTGLNLVCKRCGLDLAHLADKKHPLVCDAASPQDNAEKETP